MVDDERLITPVEFTQYWRNYHALHRGADNMDTTALLASAAELASEMIETLRETMRAEYAALMTPSMN